MRQYEVRWKEVLCLVIQRQVPMQQRMQHVDSLASWKILNGYVSKKKRHTKTRSPRQTLNSESDQESSSYVDDFDQSAVSTTLLTAMNHVKCLLQ